MPRNLISRAAVAGALIGGAAAFLAISLMLFVFYAPPYFLPEYPAFHDFEGYYIGNVVSLFELVFFLCPGAFLFYLSVIEDARLWVKLFIFSVAVSVNCGCYAALFAGVAYCFSIVKKAVLFLLGFLIGRSGKMG